MKFLVIKVPRNNEYTVEQTYSLLANLSLGKSGFLPWSKKETYSFEIVCFNQTIYFVVGVPESKVDFFQAHLAAQFKDVVIEKKDSSIESEIGVNEKDWNFAQFVLSGNECFPIKTTDKFEQTDPLASVLATMSKVSSPEDFSLFQIVLENAGSDWQKTCSWLADSGGGRTEEGNYKPHPQKQLIDAKVAHEGYKAYIRILANNESDLNSLIGSFGIFSDPTSNSLKSKAPGFVKRGALLRSILNREAEGIGQILNLQEIASLWHLPSGEIKLRNIAWGREIFHEPPEDLPVAEELSAEEKRDVYFFAKTVYKNKEQVFGIKSKDRDRHIYVIGKTGTGKSTTIANLAIESIRKGEGIAIVDPHGDLSQIILDFIPNSRVNDVCYFNPADPEFYYPLNPLEVRNPEQRELVASGIISIFKKLYAHSWGPRLEYILRNVILTLTAIENTTLADVTKILTDQKYRQSMVAKIDDEVMINFWKNEFEKMDDRLKMEAISPILNKVGQFVSSPLIRRVVSAPKSKIDIENIMNEGKILICDLSQGKIGEDNSALLGAMIITQIQLAAMNRVFVAEEERRPFTLFVDEFQNFATDAFVKILSEARKYKLNLVVANQYMSQLDKSIQGAILGNVGTLISFAVGADDSQILEKEFGREFESDDLVSLEKFQIILKESIDWQISRPFYANTLPLPTQKNQNTEKILKISRERYGKRKG